MLLKLEFKRESGRKAENEKLAGKKRKFRDRKKIYLKKERKKEREKKENLQSKWERESDRKRALWYRKNVVYGVERIMNCHLYWSPKFYSHVNLQTNSFC